jgi:hypothetical protein
MVDASSTTPNSSGPRGCNLDRRNRVRFQTALTHCGSSPGGSPGLIAGWRWEDCPTAPTGSRRLEGSSRASGKNQNDHRTDRCLRPILHRRGACHRRTSRIRNRPRQALANWHPAPPPDAEAPQQTNQAGRDSELGGSVPGRFCFGATRNRRPDSAPAFSRRRDLRLLSTADAL